MSGANKRGIEGFTLIEVMVALAVLGSALFVLLEAHYTALRTQSQLREFVIMRNLMAQAIGIAEVQVAANVLSGTEEFGRRYPGYRYDYEAQPLGTEFPGLYDCLVRVEGPNEQLHEMHLYLLSRDPEQFLGTLGESAAATASESLGATGESGGAE